MIDPRARTATLVGMALASAGAVAACGSSSAPDHTRTQAAVGAPRITRAADHLPAAHVSRQVRAEEASIHRAVSSSLREARRSRARYGSIPRDLRRLQTPPRDQVLSARPGHPADPITGVAVRMHLTTGSALAIAVGPYVPVADQGSFRNHTDATWRVTFSDVHGTVPVRASMFGLTDEQGQTLTPRVSVLGGGRVPRSAPDGRTITIVLAARTSIGSGTLAYTPTGSHAFTAWQFDAETD